MNNKKMNFLFEISHKNIWNLVELLEQSNFNFKLDFSSGISDLIEESADRTWTIYQRLKGFPLQEREEYFLANSRIFCESIKEEKFTVAHTLKKELDYFRHSFLNDSNLKNTRVTYASLKKLLEQTL